MMVVVEGRRPRCWGCKQIGHITKFCPQKTDSNEKAAATTTTTTTDTAATTTINKQAEAQGPGHVQPKTNNQEGWTAVTRKRKGSPKQGKKSPISSPPQKQIKAPPLAAAAAAPEPPVTPAPATPTPAASPRTSTATPTTPAAAVPTASSASLTSKRNKKKNKSNQPEEMETSSNLKRRRDSGEAAAKKYALNNLRQAPPLSHKNSHLLHLHLCLHHHFPLKSYNLHNLFIKWTLFPPSKNNTWKDIAAPTKSPSQGHNQLTDPNP